MRQKIIFIGGWGRSGSSVLANILGSSPQAVSVGELRYLWDRGVIENKRCGCGADFSSCEHWRSIMAEAHIDDPLAIAAGMADSVASRATLRQMWAMLTGRGLAYHRRNSGSLEILGRVYDASARIGHAPIIVDTSKTPPYALNLLDETRYELFFVHLIRDPRAVAYSWSRKRSSREADNEFLPRYSALKCAVYWNVFNLLGLLFRFYRGSHYLPVRYEAFCAQPRQVTADIFRHCGLQDDGLHWSDSHVVQVKPQHSISGNPSRFNTGEVRIRPDDEWRTHMARASRWLVTAICAPLLLVFGYRSSRSNTAQSR